MSISTVLTAAKDVVKKADYFDDKNVEIGDVSVIEGGVARAVALFYLPSEHGAATKPAPRTGKFTSEHDILIRVFRQYNDASSYTDLLTDADTIIAKFNQYPKLDATSGVDRAIIYRTSDVLALGETNKIPLFLRMDLSLEVIEEVSTDRQE
jgi:hypothetical protein